MASSIWAHLFAVWLCFAAFLCRTSIQGNGTGYFDFFLDRKLKSFFVLQMLTMTFVTFSSLAVPAGLMTLPLGSGFDRRLTASPTMAHQRAPSSSTL